MIGIVGTILNVLVHSWFGHPWDPSVTTLGLLASCIAGGIANEKLNPPPPTPPLALRRPPPAEAA